MEVVFFLAGEILFLQGAWPGPLGGLGVALTLLGENIGVRSKKT